MGDSLQLAKLAAASDAEVIVQGGVHFMAETSKILNPAEDSADPRLRGRLLACRFDRRRRRARPAQQYPGVPIVTYVNTSAEVKAESDICCTSSNAVKIVESLGVDNVIMIPDRYLAQNVAAQTRVKIIAWQGACEVHERFTAEEIQSYRAAHPGVKVLAHPECPPEVIEESDFAGSTAAMIDYVRSRNPRASCWSPNAR